MACRLPAAKGVSLFMAVREATSPASRMGGILGCGFSAGVLLLWQEAIGIYLRIFINGMIMLIMSKKRGDAQ